MEKPREKPTAQPRNPTIDQSRAQTTEEWLFSGLVSAHTPDGMISGVPAPHLDKNMKIQGDTVGKRLERAEEV